jgi:hypothetical protein
LNGKVAALVKKTELTTGAIRCADHATSSIIKKLALTSPTSGGRSVGIVRLRTKGRGVKFYIQFCGMFLLGNTVYNITNFGKIGMRFVVDGN